jgi:hypothetical protein
VVAGPNIPQNCQRWITEQLLPTNIATWNPKEFLVPIQETLRNLLQQEDTDNDCKITVEDEGPKVYEIALLFLPYRPHG